MMKQRLFIALALVVTVCGLFATEAASPKEVSAASYISQDNFDLDQFVHDSGWKIVDVEEDPHIWAKIIHLSSPDNYLVKVFLIDPPAGFYEDPHPAVLMWEYELGKWVGEYEMDISTSPNEEYYATPYGVVGSTTISTLSNILNQRDLRPGVCPFGSTGMIHCAADADGNFVFHDEHDAVTCDYY